MSNDADIPFIGTQAGSNDPEFVKTRGERRGVCPICGGKDKRQRTFVKVVTPFAIHSNTAPTKADARREQTEEVTAWVDRTFYHEMCMSDFMDLLEDTGILDEILPRIREHIAQRKAQADHITQLSVVGNGA